MKSLASKVLQALEPKEQAQIDKYIVEYQNEPSQVAHWDTADLASFLIFQEGLTLGTLL